MSEMPLRLEGYRLLHKGAIELVRMEEAGIQVDMERLRRSRRTLQARIGELRQSLWCDSLGVYWRRRCGQRALLTSRDQLACVLQEKLGYTSTSLTATGKPVMDEEELSRIHHPFVRNVQKLLRYEKIDGTFLKGIEAETVHGRLHPSFNLHTTRTYRSSSESPNFQNFPVRDRESSKRVRSVFIPSSGNVLIENDFKGIEVVLSAAYHRDPVFIRYISTPGKDMHRDMAAQIYCLPPEEVSKEARHGAKNKFVFPQFYGDYYCSCAAALWDWIDRAQLKTAQGVPLKKHLQETKGIRTLGACDPQQPPRPGTFEAHVRIVEEDFWERRFRRYGQWRKEWYRAYQDRGYFDLLTGFRIMGYYGRNAVMNYPIQGSAFHCLLWSLIRIGRYLRRRRMRTLLVGQIHDSLIADVPVDELTDYLLIVDYVTRIELPRHYPFLVVAPEVGYEIVAPGRNWSQKIEFSFCPTQGYRWKDKWEGSRDFLEALANDEKHKE